ncbi:MAG TPA: hypothetical protein VGO95_04855 [Modestobacter sp.]|nr:hypothetical protein [Modestobacter sp.]
MSSPRRRGRCCRPGCTTAGCRVSLPPEEFLARLGELLARAGRGPGLGGRHPGRWGGTAAPAPAGGPTPAGTWSAVLLTNRGMVGPQDGLDRFWQAMYRCL